MINRIKIHYYDVVIGDRFIVNPLTISCHGYNDIASRNVGISFYNKDASKGIQISRNFFTGGGAAYFYAMSTTILVLLVIVLIGLKFIVDIGSIFVKSLWR